MVDGTDSQRDLNFLRSFPEVNLVTGNLENTSQIENLIRSTLPDEIYNLGALTFVGKSFDEELSSHEALL
jgi:GDP-D-mannose dehydratase